MCWHTIWNNSMFWIRNCTSSTQNRGTKRAVVCIRQIQSSKRIIANQIIIYILCAQDFIWYADPVLIHAVLTGKKSWHELCSSSMPWLLYVECSFSKAANAFLIDPKSSIISYSLNHLRLSKIDLFTGTEVARINNSVAIEIMHVTHFAFADVKVRRIARYALAAMNGSHLDLEGKRGIRR